VPLSKIQIEVLRLLASHRDPESYVAGGTLLNRDAIRYSGGTRLEWLVESDFRFFPTIRDETFGYILHPVDLATNKVMAAAGGAKCATSSTS